MDVEDELRAALHRSMRGVDPPVTDLVSRALRDGRSARRSSAPVWAGAAAAAAVVAVPVMLTRPWADPGSGGPTGAAAPTGAVSATACRPAREDVLPTWARQGFSDPEPRIAHVQGDQGRIVAILFGRVLHAPPAAEVDNKILWVARTAGAEPLRIEAARAGDDEVVQREVTGGPGPSIIASRAPGAGT